MRSKLTNKVPPIHLIYTMIGMYLLAAFFPVATLFGDSAQAFGQIIILIGFTIVFSSAHLFRKAQTPLKPFEPVQAMITSGPFRFSRNPVYMGMFVLLFGWALFLGMLTPWIGFFYFIYIIRNYWVIPEEEQMEREIGQPYLEYKARVRRWV